MCVLVCVGGLGRGGGLNFCVHGTPLQKVSHNKSYRESNGVSLWIDITKTKKHRLNNQTKSEETQNQKGTAYNVYCCTKQAGKTRKVMFSCYSRSRLSVLHFI